MRGREKTKRELNKGGEVERRVAYSTCVLEKRSAMERVILRWV